MPSSKSRLKSENGCFNKERMELVKQLVADGNTNAEIADILGTEVGTVADMLYRWGIRRDKQRPCKMCGKPVNSSHPKTVYCEQCRKKVASECAKRSARKYSTKKDMRILRERVSRKNDSEVLLNSVLSKSGRLREVQEAAELAKAKIRKNRYRNTHLRKGLRAQGKCRLLRCTGDLAQGLAWAGICSTGYGGRKTA